MAKLRGSDTLDIKDIQTILERNWNIKIPGYSANDVRAIRKPSHVAEYQRKVGALDAQKQLSQAAGKKEE